MVLNFLAIEFPTSSLISDTVQRTRPAGPLLRTVLCPILLSSQQKTYVGNGYDSYKYLLIKSHDSTAPGQVGAAGSSWRPLVYHFLYHL